MMIPKMPNFLRLHDSFKKNKYIVHSNPSFDFSGIITHDVFCLVNFRAFQLRTQSIPEFESPTSTRIRDSQDIRLTWQRLWLWFWIKPSKCGTSCGSGINIYCLDIYLYYSL